MHGPSTIIKTQAESLHPFASVTNTQYCVVWFGDAEGFEQFVQLNPADGDHEYVIPPVAESCVELPAVIIAEEEAVAVGPFETVINVVVVCEHPFASVIVTE